MKFNFVVGTPPSEELMKDYYRLLAQQFIDKYGIENAQKIVEIDKKFKEELKEE